LRRLVVDASVAARFLLTEDLSEKAGAVLDDYIGGKVALLAPNLIEYEVGNTLWKAVQRGFIRGAEARDRLGSFFAMGIGCLFFKAADCQRALEMATTKGVTFYDASYIVAAEKATAPLLTADDVLFRAAATTVKALRLSEYA